MCYNIKYLTQKKLNYAKRIGGSANEIKQIESDLEILTKDITPTFHANGFTHPNILCFTDNNHPKIHLFQWGLIPNWIKDDKQAASIKNKTLNARIETIFEKPSFKASAYNKRCIILLDAFYDYHYINKKPIPLYIYPQNNTPLTVAGIWDSWQNSQGKTFFTLSLVTTKATGILKNIHNNPKIQEPRMPYLLDKKGTYTWLSNCSSINELSNLNTDKQTNKFTASLSGLSIKWQTI